MKQLGHFGAALLVYAPVGVVLLSTEPLLAYGGGIIVLALSTLPDCDQRMSCVRHRGPTHTVLFLVVVAGALGAAGWYVAGAVGVDPALLAAFGILLGLLGVGSHLLADVLTPMGVTPLWPFSRRHYTLAVTRADNAMANWLLLAVGMLSTVLAHLVAGRL